MDKDGGNWTKQDIDEWNERLYRDPRPLGPLRRLGRAVMRWLDHQGDIVDQNGLSPYDYPRDYRSKPDIFARDDTDDDERPL